MHVLLDNMSMICLNSSLALIPILFGWLMLKTRHRALRVIFALLWFFFLPNTLYILTDLRHLPEEWDVLSAAGKLGVAVQYCVFELIGVGSFLLALYLLEKTMLMSRWRENRVLLPLLLISVNFLMGFGIVLGRVQRLNSWDIFMDAPRVLHASFEVLSSLELLLSVVLFGVVANAVYFACRKYRAIGAALVAWWS
jgi:uncharacterized membrane protein